jgi:hypothetical protein
MPPPPFNPSAGQWGSWPWVPAASMPVLQVGSPSCNEQGYLLGVLKFKTGHTSIYCAANYGPWHFTVTVRQAVKDVQAFFGAAQTGVVDAGTWAAIHACALA